MPMPAPKDMSASREVIERVYQAAKSGVHTEDTIAYCAGLTPLEYRRLKQYDPRLEHAEAAGKAEGELEMASIVVSAARGGDPKAALEVLKHKHGWVATTAVKHEGGVSITLSTGVPQGGDDDDTERQLKDPNDIGEY
jgi:hypothetical protein